MSAPTRLQQSRTYPITVDQAFDAVLSLPLADLFDRRCGAIPAISKVTDQAGIWGTVGQSRTVNLATGGGTLREELTAVEPPAHFDYVITPVTGPMRPLIGHAEGTWSFAPVGTGCRITWQWVLHPRSAVAAAVMPIFARMWNGYARHALARIEDLAVDR